MVDTIVKQALAKLVLLLPFLSGSSFLPVIVALITPVIQWLIDETAVGLTLLYIYVDLQYNIDSADKATARLKQILESPQDYTAAQQKDIEANFDDTAVNLIHIAVLQY